MKVIIANAAGMCFGVRAALRIARGIANPPAVTIHGQLVHNAQVIVQLRVRGFAMLDEPQREEIPPTTSVLITAHGVSDAERRRLESAGKHLIDATCPLVRKAHQAALQLQAEGRHVLVIGQRHHVEVQGLTGDLHNFNVLESVASVRRYPPGRLGIICQTTTVPRDAEAIRDAVAELNRDADIRFIDTICQPTKDRQSALDDLLLRVDAVVVIGGRNSNNTRKLLEQCAEIRPDVPAYHLESAADLKPAHFAGCHTVGVTAGTSTLDSTIRDVCRALHRIPVYTPGKDHHGKPSRAA